MSADKKKHDFHLEPRTPFMQVIDKAVEPLGECIDDWAAYEKLTKAITQRAKERDLQPIDDNVIGVPIKRDFKKYHDDYTDNGTNTSVKEVIQFLLDNTSGIQNVSYDELAEKGFIRNKGSETTMHSKESPYYSDIYDSVNEKIGYKIREHSTAKVPLMAVIGKEEMASNTVSIRNLSENKTDTYSVEEALDLLVDSSSLPS